MKNTLTNITIGIIVVTIVIGIAYGIFLIKRKFNYKMGYETMVQQQIDATMGQHIKEYHTKKGAL